MKLSFMDCPMEVKFASEAGEIEGYASKWGILDKVGDVVAPGAFARSLEERKARGDALPMLWQHIPADVRGVWTEAAEDQDGLRVRGQLVMDTTAGRDALAFLRAGAIKGLSIGYVTKPGGGSYDRSTGIRTLRDVDLYEVSLVTFPALQEASVTSVKNVDEIDAMSIQEIERHMREAWGAPRTEAKRVMNRLMALTAKREAQRVQDANVKAEMERLLRRLKS